MARKVATQAPPLSQPPSTEQLQARLDGLLAAHFCLGPLPAYTIFVEGWTDLYYLGRAAELAREMTGEDLLAQPGLDRDAGEPPIALMTPGLPGNPNRGGTPQLQRLARELRHYYQTLGTFAVYFVFDHDKAGREAREEIERDGFSRDSHSLSLDPREHPGACNRDDVVIEDLLSIDIQRRFFEASGDAWCIVHYEGGRPRRYVWKDQSKGRLQEYACEHGTWDDFREIARVLHRARLKLGLPSSTALFPPGS